MKSHVNDPDILDWLETSEGQIWLNQNHQRCRYWERWAWLKFDWACPSEEDVGPDYTHPNCGDAVWHPDAARAQQTCAMTVPELTDEILSWSCP